MNKEIKKKYYHPCVTFEPFFLYNLQFIIINYMFILTLPILFTKRVLIPRKPLITKPPKITLTSGIPEPAL